VSADRTDELEILDSLYAAAEGHSFYPFRDKSHDLEYEESIELFEHAIAANSHRLSATAHLGQDGSDPERVEAVQSAVLAEEIGVGDQLVILDGNEDKAERFGRAMTGLSGVCPPVATCIQSEMYYPTSLLADLCASHLAYQITTHVTALKSLPLLRLRKKNTIIIGDRPTMGWSLYQTRFRLSQSNSAAQKPSARG